jgi:hypothetical protein
MGVMLKIFTPVARCAAVALRSRKEAMPHSLRLGFFA